MSYKIPLGFKFLLDCFGDKLVQEYYDYCKNILGFTNDEEVKSFALGYISIGEEQAKMIAEYSDKPISYWLDYQKEYDLRNRRTVTLPYVYKFIKGEVPKDEFEANIRFDLSEHLPSDIKGLLKIIGDSEYIEQNNHAYASLIEKFT